MRKINEADRTLDSDSYGAWMIVAMESGINANDLQAISRVRQRLLGAAAVADDVLGDRATVECVTEVLRQIGAESRRDPDLYW